MHRGSLVAGAMEIKPRLLQLFSVFSSMHHSAHVYGSCIWRENNMDFDMTDIYGVQSERTVKNGNVADTLLDGHLCKVCACVFSRIQWWMIHNVHWIDKKYICFYL